MEPDVSLPKVSRDWLVVFSFSLPNYPSLQVHEGKVDISSIPRANASWNDMPLLRRIWHLVM